MRSPSLGLFLNIWTISFLNNLFEILFIIVFLALNLELLLQIFFNSLLLEENNDEYFQALYNILINEDSPLKNIQN